MPRSLADFGSAAAASRRLDLGPGPPTPRRRLMASELPSLWKMRKDAIIAELRSYGVACHERWTLPEVRSILQEQRKERAPPTEEDRMKGISKLSLGELIAKCQECKVTLPAKPTRGALISLLRAATQTPGEQIMNFGKFRGWMFKETPQGYRQRAQAEVAANANHSPELAMYASWAEAEDKRVREKAASSANHGQSEGAGAVGKRPGPWLREQLGRAYTFLAEGARDESGDLETDIAEEAKAEIAAIEAKLAAIKQKHRLPRGRPGSEAAQAGARRTRQAFVGNQCGPAPATAYEPVAPGSGNLCEPDATRSGSLYENGPGAAIEISTGDQGHDELDTENTDSGEEVVRPGDHGEVRRRALAEQRRRRMEAAGPSKRAVGGISRLSSRPSPSTPRQLPPMPLMCWLGLHKIYGKCSRRSTRYPTRRTSCSSSLERRGCHTLWLDFGEQPWNHTTNCTDTTSTTGVSKTRSSRRWLPNVPGLPYPGGRGAAAYAEVDLHGTNLDLSKPILRGTSILTSCSRLAQAINKRDFGLTRGAGLELFDHWRTAAHPYSFAKVVARITVKLSNAPEHEAMMTNTADQPQDKAAESSEEGDPVDEIIGANAVTFKGKVNPAVAKILRRPTSEPGPPTEPRVCETPAIGGSRALCPECKSQAAQGG